MDTLIKVLADHPNGIMATANGGKPDTRVFQFLFAEGGKLYFCTGAAKPVYRQLQENPWVSFCTHAADFSPVVSMNGPIAFVDDATVKERVLRENPAIQGIYHSADNPEFKVFYLSPKECKTFSFAEGPKTIAF